MTDCPRTKSGQEGRAVRLGELIAWVVKRDDCVPVEAADRVFLALGGPVPCDVYNDAKNGGYATRFPFDSEWFATNNGAKTGQWPKGRRILSPGIEGGAAPASAPSSLGYGWDGFSKWLVGMLRGELGAGRKPQDALPWCVVLQSDARSRLGWCAAAAAPPAADGIAAPAAPITVDDVTDWPDLVQYRLQFVDVVAPKRPEWLPEHVAILAARLHEEHKAGRGKGALGRLAKELDTTRQALIGSQKKDGKPGPLVRYGYDVATGLKLATPFDGLGAQKTKAA